jgi:quercetin dioxygenase-like cupin family protein
VELRVNQVIVEPGEVTTPHTHEGQEEAFVAQTDGQISIEDEVYDVLLLTCCRR